MRTDNEVGPGNGQTSPLGRDYGEVLWQPGPELIERARITDYRRWLAGERGVVLRSASPDPTAPRFASPDPTAPPYGPGSTAYRELWDWSVAETAAFWGSLWDYFGVLGAALRSALSPRHVPDEIHQVPGIPRTLSGKKLEVPVRKILLGTPVADAAGPDALANPEVLAWFAR